jgi:hypothetical protein
MQNLRDNKDPDKRDPIVAHTDSPAERSKKRRAGYLLVLGIIVVALLVLGEWLLNGTIMLSKGQ